LHVIGDIEHPVMICKKGEIQGFFNEEFFEFYAAWRYFHYGLGLPNRKAWNELDPEFVETITTMEEHYEHHFSIGIVTLKYLETLIKVNAGKPRL
jgi:hypothetical protein